MDVSVGFRGLPRASRCVVRRVTTLESEAVDAWDISNLSQGYNVTSNLNEAEQLLQTFFNTPRVLYPGQVFGVLRSPYQFAAPPCTCTPKTVNMAPTHCSIIREKTASADESALCQGTFAEDRCWCCVSMGELESAEFFGIDAPRCLDLHARVFCRSDANDAVKCQPFFEAISAAGDVPEALTRPSTISSERTSSARNSQIGGAPSAQENVLTPEGTSAEASGGDHASCSDAIYESCRRVNGKGHQNSHSDDNSLVPHLGMVRSVASQCHWGVNPVYGFTATPSFGKESLFFQVEELQTHQQTPDSAAVVWKGFGSLILDVGLSTTALHPFAVGFFSVLQIL